MSEINYGTLRSLTARELVALSNMTGLHFVASAVAIDAIHARMEDG